MKVYSDLTFPTPEDMNFGVHSYDDNGNTVDSDCAVIPLTDNIIDSFTIYREFVFLRNLRVKYTKEALAEFCELFDVSPQYFISKGNGKSMIDEGEYVNYRELHRSGAKSARFNYGYNLKNN